MNNPLDEDNAHLQRGLGFSSNGSPVEAITNMIARRLTRRSSSVRMSQGSVCSIQIQSPTSATTELMLLSLKTNHAKCHAEKELARGELFVYVNWWLVHVDAVYGRIFSQMF